MHTKSNNLEIMMGSEADEIMDELSKSFLQKYQEGLEESMRGSACVYDSDDVYNRNKAGLSRGGSDIDSPQMAKKQKGKNKSKK